MAGKLMRVFSVEDISGSRGPRAYIEQQDAEGKGKKTKTNLFSDVAQIVLDGREGVYEVSFVKNEKDGKTYWNWGKAKKVGSSGGSGTNGSGHGAKQDNGSFPVEYLNLAFNIVNRSYPHDSKMQADHAAKEVLAIAKYLHKAANTVAVPKPAPKPEPEENMDPESQEMEWPWAVGA